MTMHLKTRLFSNVFGLLWRENHLGETANKLFKATKTSALVFDAPSTVDRHACANDINSEPFWTQKSNEKIELVDHFSLLIHVVYAEPKCDCMRMKTVMMKPIKQTFYHVSWKHCISCF